MALQPARVLDPEKDVVFVPQFAQIHHDCIITDHTMASFLPPLHLPNIVAYWNDWLEECKTGSRAIVFQTWTDSSGEGEVVGVVSLHMPYSGTGPFRSHVHKLLVSPKHRYKGIARNVMQKLEEVAKDKDRWLVVSKIFLQRHIE